MGNIFNRDFRDFLQALNNNNVEYLLVGGMAEVASAAKALAYTSSPWGSITLRRQPVVLERYSHKTVF